ncbi:hypothetical protein [Nocardioides pakistanensis]
MNREPAGVPSGGQFAGRERGEAGLDLTEIRRMVVDEYGDGIDGAATYGPVDSDDEYDGSTQEKVSLLDRRIAPGEVSTIERAGATISNVTSNLVAAPKAALKTGAITAAAYATAVTFGGEHAEPLSNFVTHHQTPVAVAGAAAVAIVGAVAAAAKGDLSRTAHPIREARKQALRAARAEAREALLDRLVAREAARAAQQDRQESIRAALDQQNAPGSA